LAGKSIKVIAGFAVTALFLWLLFRQVSLSEVLDVISSAAPEWIALSVVLFLAGYACRIERWRQMLVHQNPDLTWQHSSVPFFAAIAVNNLVPLRAGDVLRAFAFTDWLGAPTTAVLATVLVERLLDLLTLLLALALVLLLLPDVSAGLSAILGLGIAGIVLAVVLVCLVLLFPKRFGPALLALPRALAIVFPALGSPIVAALMRILDTLSHLAGPMLMLRLMLWSVCAWAFEASVFYCVARSLAQVGDPGAGLVAMPVGTLSTLVPSSPGYVGTFHYFVAKSMELMGNTFSVGTAYAVTVHLVLWLSATLPGGVCLLVWFLRRRRVALLSGKGLS